MLSRSLGSLAVLLSTSGALGCFYVLDSSEVDAKASGLSPSTGPVDAGGSPEGQYTTSLDTPPIELDFDGIDTTRDPCVATTLQAREILQLNCSECHAPPGAAGGFTSVLDLPALLQARSSTVRDPLTNEPVRLLVPGAPEQSRLYVRVKGGEMPPRRDPSLPQLRRPTTSDVSLLHSWISNCLGPSAAPGGDASPAP
jgi:hypothetical protein